METPPEINRTKLIEQHADLQIIAGEHKACSSVVSFIKAGSGLIERTIEACSEMHTPLQPWRFDVSDKLYADHLAYIGEFVHFIEVKHASRFTCQDAIIASLVLADYFAIEGSLIKRLVAEIRAIRTPNLGVKTAIIMQFKSQYFDNDIEFLSHPWRIAMDKRNLNRGAMLHSTLAAVSPADREQIMSWLFP